MSVFDKFKTGVSNVGAKSKEVMGSAKIKLDIENLKKQKKKEFENIGESVYEIFLKDDITQEKIIEMCGVISDLEEKINEKEVELEQVGKKEEQVEELEK